MVRRPGARELRPRGPPAPRRVHRVPALARDLGEASLGTAVRGLRRGPARGNCTVGAGRAGHVPAGDPARVGPPTPAMTYEPWDVRSGSKAALGSPPESRR